VAAEIVHPGRKGLMTSIVSETVPEMRFTANCSDSLRVRPDAWNYAPSIGLFFLAEPEFS
jgi:hypothetical protein